MTGRVIGVKLDLAGLVILAGLVAISLSSSHLGSDNKPDKFIVEIVGISDIRLYYVDID